MLAQSTTPAREPHEAILLAAIDVAFLAGGAGAVVDDGLDGDARARLEVLDIRSDFLDYAGELVAEGYGDFFLGDGVRSGGDEGGAADVFVEVWRRKC